MHRLNFLRIKVGYFVYILDIPSIPTPTELGSNLYTKPWDLAPTLYIATAYSREHCPQAKCSEIAAIRTRPPLQSKRVDESLVI